VSTSAAEPLVEASGLGVRYGSTEILHGIDLTVRRDAHLAVMGRSGSGKTTLLLVLAGLLAPSSGSVSWPGLSGDRRIRRGEIGMVFQAPSLMPELTALQNTTLPLRLRGLGVEASRTASMEALEAIGAADLAAALPAQLSGGQQQRVAIARALAGGHRLVLADEPTGALDRARAHQIALALRDGVTAMGGGLVLATHDPGLAEMFDEQKTVLDGDLTAGLTA
jgi:ABC-type lipoprotein export system ATPase subunit